MSEIEATNYNSLLIELGWCMPLVTYALLSNVEEYKIEAYSNFSRSTYRNQCRIGAANKVLSLSLPIQGGRHYRASYKDAIIDWTGRWPQEHLSSLKAAYMSAPYFEHYLPQVEALLLTTEPSLFRFNLNWHAFFCHTLQIEAELKFTETFQKPPLQSTMDVRGLCNFSHSLLAVPVSAYFQTFDDIYGFRQGLSILDCLFHLGPHASEYLRREGASLIALIDAQ